jgi:hypothetical protein
MNNTSTEIELGNGYGYFCNIHDIENQQPILKIVIKPKPIVRRKYSEKTKQNEESTTKCNDTICICLVVIVILTIYVFVL